MKGAMAMDTKSTFRGTVFFRCLAGLVLLGLFAACKKEESLQVEKTVLVYMAANNSLAAEAVDNINMMEQGYQDINGRLLVYARLFGQSPKIYEIVHDNSPRIVSKVLKDYPEHNSSDPKVMAMVFQDMQELGKANSYGAILWSHATNWYPGERTKRMAKTRSFGDDNGDTMDIMDLKAALPRNLDYIIFDACSMSSVEVLYELRDITPLVLASATEVISVGLPYDRIMRHLFDRNVRRGLAQTARKYYGFYNEKEGPYRSATYTLVDMKKLEGLAQAVRTVYDRQQAIKIKDRQVQALSLDPLSPVPAYDLLDFFDRNFTADEAKRIEMALNKSVVYKVHTSHFLGKPIRVYSGLSCYIPKDDDPHASYYKTLGWAKATGAGRLF
ncbi:hypothetical protein SAMN05421877_104167 [Sphingobacterium lactis]|uniref:Clostripain n=1 Tax=Sphingobacterium lactis TaxID=797291 RepID=A0A1H5WTV4_9SPHI|nr:hypothetical protein SAMN05421877_104167 [Sphingobacterium lactis]